ncbi:MAG: ABC-F family ATP-binding cassette domain-containing protein [Candidatus Omnitrophica bacterium]|nr:ABC-F family ATP-binding cassette domain-containing protein [Candidatus Omnitrophota bacterium]
MISITNLSKSYGHQDLFSGFNLTINRGEKIGLIGPNGAGKTTFFSILLGKIESSGGNVQINKNIRIGYLPQEASFKSDASVLNEVVEGDATIAGLNQERHELERKNETASKRYGEILHDLEFLGYFNVEYKAKKVLMGLGFKEPDFDRPISHMSGGWQMRVLLARLLVSPYDILLLDEPMNHLDLVAALWFKDYLTDFKGTFVMISHDKAFLNEVTNYTLVLENSVFTKVKGNYEDYQKIREQKRVHLLKQFRQQEKKREQLEKFAQRFHGQPNKASQVRAKRRMVERMEIVEVPQDRRESIRGFDFPKAQRSGHRVMGLEKISKSYGEIKVYQDFDFEVIKGEKAVLVGENGAGKSTLLKILAGVIPIDNGARNVGHNVDIGYFSQTRMDVLNPENTVLEEAYSASKGNLSTESIRTILGLFLFSGQDVDKGVSVLSGGEKSRLILAKLLINPPNFLLLDEPTTHLDVDAVDALIKALKEYEGTIVFISHDIHFVRYVANVIFEVKAGRIRKFPGDLDYYLKKSKDNDYGQVSVSDSDQKTGKPVVRPEDKDKNRQLDSKQEAKIIQEHNEKLTRKIKRLEKQKEKIEIEQYAKNRALTDPNSFLDARRAEEFKRRLGEIEKIVASLDAKIEKLKAAFR